MSPNKIIEAVAERIGLIPTAILTVGVVIAAVVYYAK